MISKNYKRIISVAVVCGKKIGSCRLVIYFMLVLESRPVELAGPRAPDSRGRLEPAQIRRKLLPGTQRVSRAVCEACEPTHAEFAKPNVTLRETRDFISPDRQVGDVESAAERCSMLSREWSVANITH